MRNDRGNVRPPGGGQGPPRPGGSGDHRADRLNFDPLMTRRFLDIHMGVTDTPCAEYRIFRCDWERGIVGPATKYSKTIGGWYDHPQPLVADAGLVRFVSSYVTVNPVKRDLWARSANKLVRLVKGIGTTDDDVSMLSWLYLDIDSNRPADVSATEEELRAATDRRSQLLAEVDGLLPASVWGCSGNGGWIFARLPNYPNDEHHRGLVSKVVTLLAAKFNDERASVDVKSRNPSRVACLPGTLKCKGADVPERPYRLVTLDSESPPADVFDPETWLAHQGRQYFDLAPPPVPPPAAATATQRGGAGRNDELVLKRATEYVNRMARSVSGQGGHDQLFDAACALVLGFGVPVERARLILREWNKDCQPPWSDAELGHKLEDADRKEGPRGYLLKGNEEEWRARQAADRLATVMQFAQAARYEGVEQASEGKPVGGDVIEGQEDNPHRLARLYLMTYCRHPDGSTLHFWHDDFWFWEQSVYRKMSASEVKGAVNRFMDEEYRRIYVLRLMQFAASKDEKTKLPSLLKVTTRAVGDVLQALSGMTRLSASECASQPEWIGGEHFWPADEMLGTRNSLIHLKSFANDMPYHMEPTPQFFSANALGYDFNPDAPEPTNWLTFLGTLPVTDDSEVQYQLWPDDPESVLTIQEWFGLHLMADTSYQKIVALIGPKRSGKGTVASVLAEMVGTENVAGPTLSDLGEKFGLEPLIGKRAAIIDDARIGPKTDPAVIAERLLSISGEGRLTLSRKFISSWTGKIPAKITLMSNEIPRLADQSGALAGRFIVLRMTRSFYGIEDNRLLDKIRPELPGILLWAVRGLKSLMTRGRLFQPETGTDLIEDLGNLSSPIKVFLDDRCTLSPNDSVRCDVLYHAWVDWCKDHGKREPGESQMLGRNLRTVIPDLKTTFPRENGIKVRKYQGLCLKVREDEDAISGWELPGVGSAGTR